MSFSTIQQLKSQLQEYCIVNHILPSEQVLPLTLSKLEAVVEHRDDPYLNDLLSKIAEIRNQIISENYGLVHLVLKKYKQYGSLYEDLFQEGVLGLFRAVDKYDPSKGAKFSSYAVLWIKDFVSNHLDRISFRSENTSIDDVGYTLQDEREDNSPYEMAVKGEISEIVHGILDKVLDERESKIISHRFSLKGSTYKTLQEIAFDEKLSKEAIRLIQKKAIKKMKDTLGE